MPRTFQGRLTVAFVAVVALTLLLVAVLVINRLDAYFRPAAGRPRVALASRRAQYVSRVAEAPAPDGRSSRPDGTVDPRVAEAARGRERPAASSRTRSARPTSRSGSACRADGEDAASCPRPTARSVAACRPRPAPGQKQERVRPERRTVEAARPVAPYAVEVTLSNPYTFRGDGHRATSPGCSRPSALFALGLTRARRGGPGAPLHDARSAG